MKPTKIILPIIVISQFFCTSLWFAGNVAVPDLIAIFGVDKDCLGFLSSCVQFGFISGTLIFALLSISDRYAPSKVFFICAILGAVFNIGIIWSGNTFGSVLFLRFLTGFFLAGIYPVGMKIATDYYQKGLGKSLGFLVGALVLGTSFPHLLQVINGTFSWHLIIILTSILALLGGVLMYCFVPEGPYRKSGQSLQLSAVFTVFKNTSFRSVSFGYFGHMWELYAFWTFIPVLLEMYSTSHEGVVFNTPLISFVVIGVGALACIFAGLLVKRFTEFKVAFSSLAMSFLCCLIVPFFFYFNSEVLFISFLVFWGMVVIADSPLFSTLVAINAPLELKGTALTIVSCIGFLITIMSIQLINKLLMLSDSPFIFTLLAIGPLLGLIALYLNKR